MNIWCISHEELTLENIHVMIDNLFRHWHVRPCVSDKVPTRSLVLRDESTKEDGSGPSEAG